MQFKHFNALYINMYIKFSLRKISEYYFQKSRINNILKKFFSSYPLSTRKKFFFEVKFNICFCPWTSHPLHSIQLLKFKINL